MAIRFQSARRLRGLARQQTASRTGGRAMTPAPIVILAPPFCGSSWLAGVLGMQPGLYAVPQLCPFMADGVDELLQLFALSQDDHGDALHRTAPELSSGGRSEGRREGKKCGH